MKLSSKGPRMLPLYALELHCVFQLHNKTPIEINLNQLNCTAGQC